MTAPDPPVPDPLLSIHLLGTFALRRDGLPPPALRTRKEAWLLALLVLRHPDPLERGWLAAALWPDSDDAQARYNLRRALGSLRAVLGPDAFRLTSPTPRSLGLDLAHVAVDALAFDAALRGGSEAELRHAVNAYGGPLLEGCDEAWATGERRQREEAFLNALDALAAREMDRQGWADAAILLRRALHIDPLRENAVQNLMRSLHGAGDTTGALTAYRAFRLLLSRELRADPSPHTQQLYRRLKSPGGSNSVQPQARQEPPVSLAPPLSRLPAALTPLIGREREREAVTQQLRSARLVTLAGAGGVGKTRLALAVGQFLEARTETGTGTETKLKITAAMEIETEDTDGPADVADSVWFVDFATVSDPARVAQTVADALRAGEDAPRGVEDRLKQHLGRKSILLLWDNCEHLAGECARLAHVLLSCCPGLRLLATSRQALGVTGESVWRVPSLSLPPIAGTSADTLPRIFGSGMSQAETSLTGELIGEETAHTYRQSEAVRLFLARAQALAPCLDNGKSCLDNSPSCLPAIARICCLLDGIPLAVELAAAWCTALTPAQILSRLEDHLQSHLLLLGRPGGAMPLRHQTLRATLEWSFALLTPDERELLIRLSVFDGGWTLEAAEAVCAEGKAAEGEEGEKGRQGEEETGSGKPTEALLAAVSLAKALKKGEGTKEGEGTGWLGRESVLPLLAGLVNKSLAVVGEQGGAARYRLLETTRAFARERLDGRDAALRERHARYFERQAREGRDERHERRNTRMRRAWAVVERANCLSALAWLRDTNPENALDFQLILYQLNVLSYHSPEMRQWIALLQQQPVPPASPLQAAIYGYVGQCADWIGQNAVGIRLTEQSLRLARAGGCLALLERICAQEERGPEAVTLLAYILASVRQTPLLHTPDHIADLHRRTEEWRNRLPPHVYNAAWQTGQDMTLDQAVAVALQM